MSYLGISVFAVSDIKANLIELWQLLRSYVHAVASIGFILPYLLEDTEIF